MPHHAPTDTSKTCPTFLAGHRYNSYNDWVKAEHGGRLQKISLDAGFTCPNRDGTRAVGGCTFCDNRGFTPGYVYDYPDLLEQLEVGLEFVKRRYPEVKRNYPDAKRFLAYFQSFSNTYGSVEHLRATYEKALSHPDVCGIVIGTRPDCLEDGALDLLAELAQKHMVELEIGIESCNDDVLRRCNRGHTFAETLDAIDRAAQRGLFLTGHLLLGLPGETHESLLAGAKVLSHQPLNSLKFHQLQIVKGTILARQWSADPKSVPLLSMQDYLGQVVDVLELLPEHIKIQRLGSEVPERMRLSEQWGTRMWDLPAALDEVLLTRDTWQGRLFE